MAAADERLRWVLLTMVAGIGPVRFRRLLEVRGSATSAWHAASEFDLAAAGFDRRGIESFRQLRASMDPAAVLARLQRLGIHVLTLLDDDYPASLRTIPDPPPVLFLRGRFTQQDALAAALVGTRRATVYGRTVAERFGRQLAQAGVTVVSGLAKGIDTVAQRAALDAGGRTIAVLAHGLDQVYPPENAALVTRLVEGDLGAAISEFPPGVPPDAANFPRRNRIISGLSRATVIVEAGHRSGALITADFALEQGREVLAVPGSILAATSEGTNRLIKDGAGPATEAQDILDALGLGPSALHAPERAIQPSLPLEERSVLEALGPEPRHVDELARRLTLPTAAVTAALTLLELKGLARQAGGMAYTRA